MSSRCPREVVPKEQTRSLAKKSYFRRGAYDWPLNEEALIFLVTNKGVFFYEPDIAVDTVAVSALFRLDFAYLV